MSGLLAAIAGSLSAPPAPGTVTLNATYDVIDSPVSGDASGTFTLESDGDIIRTVSSLGSLDLGDWLSPKASAPSLYEVRATINSGSLTSGTTGSWLALTSTRSWTRTQTTVGNSIVELIIEIRYNGGSVLDSTTVTIDVTKS